MADKMGNYNVERQRIISSIAGLLANVERQRLEILELDDRRARNEENIEATLKSIEELETKLKRSFNKEVG